MFLRLSALSLIVFFHAFGLSQTEQKAVPSSSAINDETGRAVAVNGELAITGAALDDESFTDQGSAYIWRFNGSTWIEESKLIAPDAAQEDQFGRSVAIENDIAVIGAPQTDDNGANSGSVYVYRYNGGSWMYEAELHAMVPNMGDEFGHVVSISNGTILIGAPYEDGTGVNDRGAAYFFSHNGVSWQEDQKVTYGFSSDDDFFAYSLDLDEDRAVIGAYLDDDNGVNSGSAFVYDYDGSTWNETQKITASNGATGDAFGFAVSIEDDRLVSGAYANSTLANGAGAVYVYELNGTWLEDTILYASDYMLDDWFGFSLELDSISLAIGSFHNDDLGAESGSCYFFRHNGTNWIEEFNLTASDGDLGDEYAYDVSVNGMQLMVGGAMNDDNGTNSGSVYFYPLCTYAPEQDLCLASVFPGTDDNMVIWHKPLTTFIDSFVFYSDGNVLTKTAYEDNSEFLHNVNAEVASKYYNISTLNYCSIEGDTSLRHKTIHLTGTLGTNNEHVLSWEPYEGFSFLYYRVWRDTSGTGNNFHLLFATLASQQTYTDNYESLAGNQYYIEVEKGSNCDGGNSILSSSYSNIFDYNHLDVKHINPFSKTVISQVSEGQVYLDFLPENTHLELMDLSGKLLASQTQLSGSSQIQGLSTGIYLIRLINEQGHYQTKLFVR